jgi:hypothetical protein
MTIGCPVVVSNSSCLPEICGDAALYASPTQSEEWLQRFVALRGKPIDACTANRARVAPIEALQLAGFGQL